MLDHVREDIVQTEPAKWSR